MPPSRRRWTLLRAALLSKRPPQPLSATELQSRVALLEDAARACCGELASRTTTLHALPDEIQQIIFGLLCDALDPRSAVAYSSTSKGLREPMQRLDEGVGKALLEQLKEENAAAAALCLKMRRRGCKALREARKIWWRNKGFSATDLATLGKLTPVLPALETLRLYERSASAGSDGGQLVEGLGVGALPAVTHFALLNVCLGDAGASALAAALDRGALPRLKFLTLYNAAIGDAGLGKKHLVLVLGGVSYAPFAITTINRMYARLAENLRDAPGTADVVVVDPVEWKFGDKNGITEHYRMELQDFAEAHPLQPYLDRYDRVAIVDDLQFHKVLGTRERDEVVNSDAYKHLIAYADAHRGRVAWWECFDTPQAGGGSRGSEILTRGMREINNNVRRLKDGSVVPVTMEHARLFVIIKGSNREMYFGEAPAPADLLDRLLLQGQ